MAVTLALLDAGVILVAVWSTTAVWARGLSLLPPGITVLVGQGAVICACCLITFYYSGLYDFRVARNFLRFASRLPVALVSALILLAIFYTLFPEIKMEMSAFVATLLVVIVFLLLLRAGFYKLIRSRPFIKQVLILGTGPLARSLMEEIEAQPDCGYSIVGVIGDGKATKDRPFPYPVLGHVHWLAKIIEEAQPDGLVVALPGRERLPAQRLLECRLRGIFIEDGVEVYERLAGKVAIEWQTPTNLIFSKDFRKPRLALAAGRALSLLAAVVGLILLSPVLGVVALAIKLDSLGPVFVVQERVGLNGRAFKLIKFRTMHPAKGNNSEWSEWFLDNSHRVTRLGKWLRKFRLDELPQLINVLLGDMNLVGPRPFRVAKFWLIALVSRNVPECGEPIAYCSLRSLVRPGLTGWAQIRYGYAGNLDEEIEKIRYDLYYIKHISLWLDLRILFDTVKTILLGKGSTVTASYYDVEAGSEKAA